MIEKLTRSPLSLHLRFRQLPRLGEPVRAFDGPKRLPTKTPICENGTDIFSLWGSGRTQCSEADGAVAETL